MSRSHPGRPKSRRRRHGDVDREPSERQIARDRATPGVSAPVVLPDLEWGVVVLAWVPLDDGSGVKARPVVVAGVHGHEVEVYPITASPLAPGRVGLEIDDWLEAGLARRSAVVLRRRVLHAETDVIEVMGRLRPDDAARLRDELVTVVSAYPIDPR